MPLDAAVEATADGGTADAAASGDEPVGPHLYPSLAEPPRWLHPRPDGETIHGLVYTQDGELVANTIGDVRFSNDGGRTWAWRANPGISTELVVTTAGELVRADRGTLYVSSDGGRSWGQRKAVDFAVDELWTGGDPWVGSRGGQLARSTDGGRTWTKVHSVRTRRLDLMGTADCLFALGQEPPVLLVSKDAGAHFRELVLAPNPAPSKNDPRVQRETVVGAYCLPDGGVIAFTWLGRVLFAPDLAAAMAVDGGAPALTADPLAPALHFTRATALAKSGEVIVTGEGGAIYVRSRDGRYRSVAPADGRSLFAAATRGDEVVLAGASGAFVRMAGTEVVYRTEPAATTRHLEGVWGTGDTIVAVGHSGTIVRSDDSGATWRLQPSPASEHLQAVHGASAEKMVAVGDKGIILASDDAGAHWRREAAPNERNLFDVFMGPDFAIAVGHETVIAKRGTGPWTRVETGTTDLFKGIWARSPSEIYIAGTSVIMGSRDGGKTFRLLYESPKGGFATAKASFDDISGNAALVVASGSFGSRGSVAVSRDGESFTIVRTPVHLSLEAVTVAPNGGIDAAGAALAWSRDAQTFESRSFGIDFDARDAWRSPSGYVVYVGADGGIVRLDDGALR